MIGVCRSLFQHVFIPKANSKDDKNVLIGSFVSWFWRRQTQVADCTIRLGLPCRFWCLTVLFSCNVRKELVTIQTGSFQVNTMLR